MLSSYIYSYSTFPAVTLLSQPATPSFSDLSACAPAPPIAVTPLTMPRKEFQRDLIQASVPGRFPHLKGVRAGEEHGSVLFTYTVPFSTQTIDFQTSVLSMSLCPSPQTTDCY